MSDIKWIKITNDIFEDEKIDFILDLDDGDAIFLMWLHMYLRAKSKRNLNRLIISDDVPYTLPTLAYMLKYSEERVERAVNILTDLGMMSMDEREIRLLLPWLSNSEVRSSPEYREWRTSVFERDGYTCRDCGSKGYLQAHHIKQFATHKNLRLDVSNGITLCKECHRKRHSRQGVDS